MIYLEDLVANADPPALAYCLEDQKHYFLYMVPSSLNENFMDLISDSDKPPVTDDNKRFTKAANKFAYIGNGTVVLGSCLLPGVTENPFELVCIPYRDVRLAMGDIEDEEEAGDNDDDDEEEYDKKPSPKKRKVDQEPDDNETETKDEEEEEEEERKPSPKKKARAGVLVSVPKKKMMPKMAPGEYPEPDPDLVGKPSL